MKRETVLIIAALLMAALGLLIGYLGLFSGPAVLLPPVVTAVGFLVVAWVFFVFRNKQSG